MEKGRQDIGSPELK